MQEALLNSTRPTKTDSRHPVKAYSPHDVFFCPEESQFYAQCIEKMVFNSCTVPKNVIEFGAGDGSPVISSLLKTKFQGSIHGYELGAAACEVARSRIKQCQLTDRYTVHNQCFFEGTKSKFADHLIANPPYLPAPDDRICMPALHGGTDGATITNRLLSVGCDNVMLMISAYSNPVETIRHALAEGYWVADFMVTPLRFGYYSSEPKVKSWIAELRKQKKAFYSKNIYFLAGVLFQKQPLAEADLSTEFLKVITAL